MAKKKIKVKVDKPRVRKTWGNVKPFSRVHGSTKFDRKAEKSKVEDEIKSELEADELEKVKRKKKK